jgi:hypothetical protein
MMGSSPTLKVCAFKLEQQRPQALHLIYVGCAAQSDGQLRPSCGLPSR